LENVALVPVAHLEQALSFAYSGLRALHSAIMGHGGTVPWDFGYHVILVFLHLCSGQYSSWWFVSWKLYSSLTHMEKLWWEISGRKAV